MRKIIAVAGPTAVGKTKYAIETAKTFNGEIVSCDSMQLYKYMNIGSAKPTAEEQAEVKHWLVDEIDPKEPFSVAKYSKMAKDAIEDIFSRGKTPVIEGGTGLYLNSLLYEMNFSGAPVDMELRATLENEAELFGPKYLYNKLKDADSKAAETYANIIAVREGDEDTDKTKALVDAVLSDKVRDFINENYAGAVVPVF